MEDIELILEDAKESMEKAVSHVEAEYMSIRAGKANPGMLHGIKVEYYGNATPLDQVSSINTPDARTIVIKPWEKGLVSAIETAIMNSDLGLNPQNDGDLVRLNIPPLTEERRKELVKHTRHEGENGKISIRNIRKDANASLKKLQKEGVAEDTIKSAEDEVQTLTDKYIAEIDKITEKKEEEIMTI